MTTADRADLAATDDRSAGSLRPEDEVARICADLIRIDSTNPGDGTGPGERAAAEYVMAQLAEVGLEGELLESAPGRANVVVRLEGADPGRPGLAVHGHLDVVPANAADWQVDPFAAEERDGCIWGRGAVDMKDMDAMILASIRDFARTGTRPARADDLRLLRRRGGRWHLGQPLVRRPPRVVARGCHRGGERGRRLQRHAPDARGRATRLPAADGGEGHRVAAPASPRPRGPRLRAQRRERHRAARRSHRSHRGPRVAEGVHRVGARAARGRQRAHRHQLEPALCA